MTQTRWFCATCSREWVHARGWTETDGCPGCHSSQVRQVTFTAAFPGGDLPRRPQDVPDVDVRLQSLDYVAPPPLTLVEPR
jgi:hypothetical protein